MANNHGPRPPTSQFSRKPLRYHTGQLRVNYRYCLCLSDNRSIVSVTTPPRGLAPPYLPARVERGRSEHTYSPISARFRYFPDIKIHAHVCSNFRPSIKYTIIHQRCVTKLQRDVKCYLSNYLPFYYSDYSTTLYKQPCSLDTANASRKDLSIIVTIN